VQKQEQSKLGRKKENIKNASKSPLKTRCNSVEENDESKDALLPARKAKKSNPGKKHHYRKGSLNSSPME